MGAGGAGLGACGVIHSRGRCVPGAVPGPVRRAAVWRQSGPLSPPRAAVQRSWEEGGRAEGEPEAQAGSKQVADPPAEGEGIGGDLDSVYPETGEEVVAPEVRATVPQVWEVASPTRMSEPLIGVMRRHAAHGTHGQASCRVLWTLLCPGSLALLPGLSPRLRRMVLRGLRPPPRHFLDLAQ